MRKLTFLLVAVTLLSVFAASASPVTQQQALNEATAFVQQRQASHGALKMAARAQRLQASAEMGYYYVFNIGTDGGFVVVSGDDRTNPILGFSFEGTFDANRVPVNMKNWLDGYVEQMRALDAMSDAQVAQSLALPRRTRAVDTRNSIAPLITSKWNQAAPYWNKCPEFMSIDENGDTIGEFAYTGCVATSMSQIMNYYKWPVQTTKVIPGYMFSYPNGDYTYSSVEMEELPVTTFDWEHMKDSYNGSEEQVYTDAVSTLMYYVGCAVKSQYYLTATGAYTDDIPKGFTEFFAYDPTTIQIKFRTDFTQENWDNMVYQELVEGRPLIYNGTAGSSGGHSFVCDGYEYGDYFHINWGWGGMGNGYFQLAILNPQESGIGGASSAEGYNMKQNIVIGIQPGDPAGSGQPEPQVEDALTVTGIGTYGTFTRDNQSVGFSIYKNKYFTLNYADHVGTQKRYDVGVAFYNLDGTFHSMIINRGTYSTALTSALGSYCGLGKDITDVRNAVKMGAGMVGTYNIVPMFKLEGTNEWKPMLESDRYYLECTMTATTATFVAHPMLNLAIQGMEFEGGEKVGSPEKIHVTLKNNSADRYFGDLYMQFGNQQIDEYSLYTTAIQAEVLAGETATVTFNVTPANAGTQTIRLYYDANCSKPVNGSASVDITQSSEAAMNMSVAITAENAVNGVIYDSHAHFRVDITNNGMGEYNKYVLAPLFLVTTNESGNVSGEMITYSQSALSLQPGETKTLYFDFDNLAFGSTYSLNIYARNENDALVNIVTPGGSVLYQIERGLVTWDGTSMTGTGVAASGNIIIPANALAARLEGLNITSVTPNGNPNTIYLIGDNEPVPAGLEGLNVVKGNQAEHIQLTDGYGYFTPQSFTTAEISYKRTFDKVRRTGEAAAWSTIVLPFAPQTITAAGNDVALAADQAAAADLWVARFAQEVDSVPAFECVAQMEANVPYLVAAAQAMKNQVITWQASDILLKAEPIAYTSGENYLMAGNFVPQSIETIYFENTYGSNATLMRSSVVPAFRAYFKALTDVADNGEIRFPGDDWMPSLKLGDVNLDGNIDVEDVNALVNVVLQRVSEGYYGGITDINDDGAVDVDDVNALINIILSNG